MLYSDTEPAAGGRRQRGSPRQHGCPRRTVGLPQHAHHWPPRKRAFVWSSQSFKLTKKQSKAPRLCARPVENRSSHQVAAEAGRQAATIASVSHAAFWPSPLPRAWSFANDAEASENCSSASAAVSHSACSSAAVSASQSWSSDGSAVATSGYFRATTSFSSSIDLRSFAARLELGSPQASIAASFFCFVASASLASATSSHSACSSAAVSALSSSALDR